MSKLWRTDRIKRPGYPPRPTQHANTADATVSLTRLPEHLCSESGPHKPSSLIHQEPIMSQTRASIPYVTAFTPQENSNVSPNGSRSKLAILQPFGVNPDNPPIAVRLKIHSFNWNARHLRNLFFSESGLVSLSKAVCFSFSKSAVLSVE